MGRFKTGLLSVTSLALLGLNLPVIAQESAQQQKPAPSSTTTKTKRAVWTERADGIWEAYVPKFSGDDEPNKPEFAVLRLSSTAFAEFQKDKVALLNKYKVFGHKVKKLVLYSEAKPKDADPPDSQYYYVTLSHWPTSTAAAQAYPGWSEPAH